MTINTKFNVGDEVYLMFANCVRREKIRKVSAWTIDYSNMITIVYYFDIDNRAETREERRVFSTKEELLNSL